MKLEITVYADGSLSELEATAHPGVEVVWIADGRAFDFTVKFVRKVPFKAPEWRDREETGTMQTNREVHGTIKSHGHGRHNYPYTVTVGTSLGPLTGPDLIVDGGEGLPAAEKAPKPPKKSKKAKKGEKAKKAKKTKKGRKTKKSAKKR